MATSSLLLFLSLVLPAFALYDPSGPVELLNPTTFNTKIRNSNHSSIVEFFAPWLPRPLNLI
jgi:protein disulfide-isomerase A6